MIRTGDEELCDGFDAAQAIGVGDDLTKRGLQHGAGLVRGHVSSGVCRIRSMVLSRRAPIAASVARWSAASVTVTSGLIPSRPSTAHGRGITAPKPIRATCGG